MFLKLKILWDSYHLHFINKNTSSKKVGNFPEVILLWVVEWIFKPKSLQSTPMVSGTVLHWRYNSEIKGPVRLSETLNPGSTWDCITDGPRSPSLLMAELEAHFDHYVILFSSHLACLTAFPTAPADIRRLSTLRLPLTLNDQLFLVLLCSKHLFRC